MNNANFDFLTTSEKINEAKNIEKNYWSYYFNCDDWSNEDIVFKLMLTYNFSDTKVLTDEEFNKVIEVIQAL